MVLKIAESSWTKKAQDGISPAVDFFRLMLMMQTMVYQNKNNDWYLFIYMDFRIREITQT